MRGDDGDTGVSQQLSTCRLQLVRQSYDSPPHAGGSEAALAQPPWPNVLLRSKEGTRPVNPSPDPIPRETVPQRKAGWPG